MQVSVIKKIHQFSKIEEEKKMKLPELKKKFTKKYVIRIIAGVLVVGMVGTGVSTANVFAAKTAQESTESTESTEKDSKKSDTKDSDPFWLSREGIFIFSLLSALEPEWG